METPAPTPETIVPSETTQESAVSPPLASAAEAVDGKQSQPVDFNDPDNWEAQLAAFEAQGGSEAASEAPPVAETAAPEAVTQTAETPPAAGDAAVDEDDADPSAAKYGPQHRVRPRSETDAAALALMRRNQDMTMAEALAKVTGNAQPEAAAPLAVVSPVAAAVSTLETISADMETLNKELREAAANLDGEAQGEILIKINEKIEEKMLATAAKAQAEAAENAAFEAQVQKAESEVLRLYPSADAPNSALNAKMNAIADAMHSSNNPLINDPQFALIVAQMAANELRIAPATATPTPAPAVQAVPPRALPQVRPAAGGTVSGAVAPAALSDVSQVGSPDYTPEQWEKFMAEKGLA